MTSTTRLLGSPGSGYCHTPGIQRIISSSQNTGHAARRWRGSVSREISGDLREGPPGDRSSRSPARCGPRLITARRGRLPPPAGVRDEAGFVGDPHRPARDAEGRSGGSSRISLRRAGQPGGSAQSRPRAVGVAIVLPWSPISAIPHRASSGRVRAGAGSCGGSPSRSI